MRGYISDFFLSELIFTRNKGKVLFSLTLFYLQEIGHTSSDERSNAGSVNLEDYEPIDPVPSSMTSIKPGPIQHGTPLMPYIPQPSPPPEHPKQGGFP